MSGYDENYITAMKQITLSYYQANYVKLGKFVLFISRSQAHYVK